MPPSIQKSHNPLHRACDQYNKFCCSTVGLRQHKNAKHTTDCEPPGIDSSIYLQRHPILDGGCIFLIKTLLNYNSDTLWWRGNRSSSWQSTHPTWGKSHKWLDTFRLSCRIWISRTTIQKDGDIKHLYRWSPWSVGCRCALWRKTATIHWSQWSAWHDWFAWGGAFFLAFLPSQSPRWASNRRCAKLDGWVIRCLALGPTQSHRRPSREYRIQW